MEEIQKIPSPEKDNVDHPISLYATKKSNELMAHSYSHLYKLCVLFEIFYSLRTMGATGYGPNDFCKINLQKRTY